MVRTALASAVVAAAVLAAGAAGVARAPRADFAGVAWNILPPGQSGDLRFPPTASDQLTLYDRLTPLFRKVPRDLSRYFKPERFGVSGKVVRVERPRPGVRILRDVDAYLLGINAKYRSLGYRPWTARDVIAVGALLGANLGVGGGDETRRALFLDALQKRDGAQAGLSVWDDLAEQQDPQAPVS